MTARTTQAANCFTSIDIDGLPEAPYLARSNTMTEWTYKGWQIDVEETRRPMWMAISPERDTSVSAKTYEDLLTAIEDAIHEDLPLAPQWPLVLILFGAAITFTLAVVAFT